MTPPILEVENLVKNYGKICAVNQISFQIPKGVCFGLLGPNGAGKTTTIEIIEGVIPPTSGAIYYKGEKRDGRFKEEVGIQFQSTALFHLLSVKETLETFRNLYKNPPPIERIVSMCYLEDIIGRRNDKISGGQRQRLMLAIALVNDPELVFLDEPTTGLDPQARRHLWDIVENIRSEGKTVVLTTHYMEEAQKLCDEILIMDRGKIILEGPPEALLREHCSGVAVTLPKESSKGNLRSLVDEKPLLFKSGKIFENQKYIEFYTENVNECIKILLDSGVDLSRITLRSRNLEDLFLEKTGHRLRN
jgi:ABC-2 type transport system ATP-binding protein